MFNLLLAQWKKTKRTAIRPAVFSLPILFSLLVFLCLFLTKGNGTDYQSEYIGFFLFLSIVTQFFSGLTIFLFIQLDQKAGNFGNELRIGINKTKYLLSKILFFLAVLVGVYMLSVSLFLILQIGIRHSSIEFFELMLFFFCSLIFQAPIIICYFWIAYNWNLVGIVLAGVVFFLSSVLLGTTELGGKLWIFIPSVWSTKMIFKIIPEVLWPTTPLIQASSKILMSETILISFLLLIFLFILFTYWYNKWEGNLEMGE